MNETHSHPAGETAPIASPELAVADGHGHSHGHDEHHDVSKHVKKYLAVGALLLIFTLITVGLSYVDFGSTKLNMAIGMAVATFKAGLVAMIFMHLSAEKQLIYRILIFTGFFVLGLFWLTYLHWYDPISR
ncbi:MAG: cytochrome C oxidase subunit IV family protein [Verrucomicrobiota bacterium]|nr:cytochrome C oxidase subunit IV family protein [Verrucomicrobiota bacterium]